LNTGFGVLILRGCAGRWGGVGWDYLCVPVLKRDEYAENA
jgi:hypothetical protein